MKAASIYFISNAGWFSSILFVPIFAQQLGASGTEIGIIVAGYGLASLISSYIFGRLADVHGRRLFLRLGLGLSAIACVTQVLSTSPEILLATRVLVGFCAGIFPAALMAYAFESKWNMGRFMSYGSLGWGVGTIIAGIIATVFTVKEPFLLSAFLFLISFVISMKMPFVKDVKMRVPFFPVHVIKKNMPIYLTILIRHTGACAIWVTFPIFIEEQGGSFFWIGIIYFVNTVTQFIIMRKLRWRSTKLMIWGFILSIVTFILFTLSDNFWQLIPMQVCLAAAWACLYVGSIKYIMARNAERATATGFLNSILSTSSICGALIGGVIAEHYGYSAPMYLAAVLSLVSLIIFMGFVRRDRKHRSLKYKASVSG